MIGLSNPACLDHVFAASKGGDISLSIQLTLLLPIPTRILET